MFHNVEELEETEMGMRMWRLPHPVRKKLNEGLRENTARFGSGNEFRFKLKGDRAVLHLRAEQSEEANVCFIYYGSIQGGWQYSSKVIGTEDTAITVVRPDNPDVLKKLSAQQNLPFSPEVVRIVLPYGNVYYLGREGDICPPEKADMPSRTYLAYGSSITHGSLALGAPHTYAFQIGRMLGFDYLNKGFAGTAQAESAMAEWIRLNREWDVASFELGINMLFMEDKVFRKQIHSFMSSLAGEIRPMFFTDIFGMNDPFLQEKASHFRRIVREEFETIFGHTANAHYTDGLALLHEPGFVSQDMVHPSLEGTWAIAERWHSVMAGCMSQGRIL